MVIEKITPCLVEGLSIQISNQFYYITCYFFNVEICKAFIFCCRYIFVIIFLLEIRGIASGKIKHCLLTVINLTNCCV